MNYCKYCGRRLDVSFAFCPDCGKRLTGPGQSSSQPPPQARERRGTGTYYSPGAESPGPGTHPYRQEAYQNVRRPGNTGAPPQKTSNKIVIPVALAAFIAVMLLINTVSNRSSSEKKPVSPTPPAISISIPPELFNVRPTVELPESLPGPTHAAGYDEEELFENIGENVLSVLKAITERSDYVLGSFEPLIGVTDVNKDGHAEILAVYETQNNGSYEVSYDVWNADPLFTNRVMSGILYFEVGGNSGVVYLLRDSKDNPYVMLEQDMLSGEYFQSTYDLYKFSGDGKTIDYYGAWQIAGRYDTDNGGVAEEKYYMMQSDWAEISEDEFARTLDEYIIVYSLDIISGEYDWDNTLSFDWAWKLFGQAS